MKQIQKAYGQGKVTLDKLIQRLQSWEAHLKHGDTYRLRRSIFNQYAFVRLS
jgi:hypothetical protein